MLCVVIEVHISSLKSLIISCKSVCSCDAIHSKFFTLVVLDTGSTANHASKIFLSLFLAVVGGVVGRLRYWDLYKLKYPLSQPRLKMVSAGFFCTYKLSSIIQLYSLLQGRISSNLSSKKIWKYRRWPQHKG